MTDLLPTRAAFTVSEPVEVEARELSGPTTVSLWHLEHKLDEVVVDVDSPLARFGVLPAGGYGVEADDGARTALDVQRRTLERLRYGFVSDYGADRAVDGVVDNVRRLHLNAVQFYDWMYRHAQLLPPTDEFEDALGRPVSLPTVRRLAEAVRGAGSSALGYAAVYAVGAEARDVWADARLVHGDGSPWMLADFLWIVDPGNDRWLSHLETQLAAARSTVGFDGFHLDQYGAPKRALRNDGSTVDLADAFPALIERLRAALPDAALLFNNVNDFPTWTTATTPQDGVYIEVWSPHDRLDHLASLIERARALAPCKPVSLAAYLSAYARDDLGALEAMRLELATVFSHGATCLLHGEEDAILVDPYYVRHEHLDVAGRRSARDFYDFAVRYGDLLLATPDVTRSHTGGTNDDVRVGGSTGVATDCVPGTVWARVLGAGTRQVVSLIDLTAQQDVRWDAPKARGGPVEHMNVGFRRIGARAPRIFAAAPDAPSARELESSLAGDHHVARVPPWSTWTLVWAET